MGSGLNNEFIAIYESELVSRDISYVYEGNVPDFILKMPSRVRRKKLKKLKDKYESKNAKSQVLYYYKLEYGYLFNIIFIIGAIIAYCAEIVYLKNLLGLL